MISFGAMCASLILEPRRGFNDLVRAGSVQPFLTERLPGERFAGSHHPRQPQRTTPRRNGREREEQEMADLVLIYGMRLLPADEVKQVGSAPVALHNGNEAQVTMHVLEGSREQIENQLKQSIDAFFDFYPEI
jgi:hypothetical protein